MFYYIRITEICPETVEQLRNVLKKFKDSDGLILDLRGNPGGLLECAAETADLFLDGGVIVTTLNRNGDRKEESAHSESTWSTKIPIVVLVDSGTASAAEILAGSLVEYGRAVTIGERTKGKGAVQSLIDLPDNLGKISLTTAEFFITEDIPIQKKPGAETWGVTPTIPVQWPTDQRALWMALIKESEHLKNLSKNSPPPPASLVIPGLKRFNADIPLQRAEALLKNPAQYKNLIEAAKTKRQLRLEAKAKQTESQEADR